LFYDVVKAVSLKASSLQIRHTFIQLFIHLGVIAIPVLNIFIRDCVRLALLILWSIYW